MTPGKNPPRQPQQHSHEIKRVRSDDQRHACCGDAPRDHDPRDPEPGSHLLHRQIARHLAKHIGDVEQPAAKPERSRRQADILVHLQRGETGVDAIDERDEVTDHQEGNDAERHLPHRFLFHLRWLCCS
jgi:hypothetical protein